jgi:hypothetical protein
MVKPYYSTPLIVNKNFHILSSFNVNKMGSHWVLFLLYFNTVLKWPDDGCLQPKHVAKYNLIVIIATCLDVCCVLTVHNILYKSDNTQQDGLSKKKKYWKVYHTTELQKYSQSDIKNRILF